jgi:hypothetical protein
MLLRLYFLASEIMFNAQLYKKKETFPKRYLLLVTTIAKITK